MRVWRGLRGLLTKVRERLRCCIGGATPWDCVRKGACLAKLGRSAEAFLSVRRVEAVDFMLKDWINK